MEPDEPLYASFEPISIDINTLNNEALDDAIEDFIEFRVKPAFGKWDIIRTSAVQWMMDHTTFFTSEEKRYIELVTEKPDIEGDGFGFIYPSYLRFSNEDMREDLGISKRRLWDLQRHVYWKCLEIDRQFSTFHRDVLQGKFGKED